MRLGAPAGGVAVRVRDVPQDPGSCLGEAGHLRIAWAVGENGRYQAVPTVG